MKIKNNERGEKVRKCKYDVSIIIPVYNVEAYLRECIESLIKQDYNFEKIEIILIDDGSKDNGPAICEEYAQQYPNIKFLKQKNSGVSTARNNGIKNASGKYIMILDSDDTLSSNAVSALVDFFNQHYDEIDIVTYPIKFNRNGKISDHTRYEAYDKGTAIYDIEEYIYLNQSTVNIMFKNEFEKNQLYNVNMKLSEDQNFDTQLIMRKGKIGYVEDAIYYYRRHDASVSNSRNNLYYCFEDIVSYNEHLLSTYKKDGKIPRYIQSLVINTIKWRLTSDVLFPYHFEKKEYKKAEDRIKGLIRQIDVDVVLNVPHMDLYHKFYLLTLAGHTLKMKVDKKLDIYCDNELVYQMDELEGFMKRIKIRNHKLSIMGDILSPTDEKKLTLYIEKEENGKKTTEKVPLKFSNESYHASKIMTANALGFDFSFPIHRVKSFKLYVMINNKRVDLSLDFKRFAPSDFISEGYHIFYCEKNGYFKVEGKTFLNLCKSRLKNLKRCFKKKRKAIVYRLLHYIPFTNKPIWIYMDRDDVVDNAYTQFKHDFYKNDSIKRYYVTGLKQDKIEKLFDEKEQKHLVRQHSLKHKMLYLKCNKIVTAFAEVPIYCPFNTAISYYNDLTDYDLVYLQHGILHASLLNLYAKEFTEIDKFIISTTFEKENLTSKYHYKLEDLIPSGMPRMETKKTSSLAANKILYAPSWRNYLIGNLVNNKRMLKEREFLNSNYFKKNYEFLHSKELQEMLEENNLLLEFKLHPIFKEYGPLFELDGCKNVCLSFDKTNIEEYKLFITDFSSFQFDFVNLKRPIIYFVPDMEEFKAGLHSYRELDLKYEDAFGKLCLTAKELEGEIKEIIKKDFKIKPVYQKRMENFFVVSKNPCEKIYKELMK